MYSRKPVLSIHSAGTASNCKQDRCNCSRASPYSKSEKTCNSSCKRQISRFQFAYMYPVIAYVQTSCVLWIRVESVEGSYFFIFVFCSVSVSGGRPELLSLSFGKLKLRCKCSCKRLWHLSSEKYAKTDGMVLHNIKACASWVLLCPQRLCFRVLDVGWCWWANGSQSQGPYPYEPCRRPRHMPSRWKQRNAEARNR